MELVARKADLVRELQFFQQIVERKNTIPILANVLLEGSWQRSDAAGHRSRSGAAQPLRSGGEQAWLGDIAGEEILRGRSCVARRRREYRDRQGRDHSEGFGRAVQLEDADAAARGFSKPAGSRRWSEGDDQRQVACADGRRRRSSRSPGRTRAFISTARSSCSSPMTMTFVATDGHRLALVNVKHDGQQGRRHQGDPAAQDAGGTRPAARRGRRPTCSTSAARIICSSRSARAC